MIDKEELYRLIDKINMRHDKLAVSTAFRELMTAIELMLEETDTVVYYDLWKIVGWSPKKYRYYEVERNFQKTFEAVRKSRWSRAKAYRFTSEGWKEIKK